MKNQKKSQPDSDQARKKSPPRSSSVKRPAEAHRIEDIDQPRQADEALRESEERFRQLAEATFEGIAIHDKGLILDVNSSFCKMFGYDRAEVIGKSVLELAAPKSRDLVIQNVRSGYEKPYEAVGLRRDGTTFAGELQGRSIQYQGRTVRVTAVRDITERKRAEAWQEAIFEGSRDAIFITAVNSRIAAVNEAACVLTGYSREELLSMRIPDLHEEADLHAYQMYHDRIMAGEETFSEAKIFRKDGSKVDTEFNNRRIVIDGLPYMHTTARDITERKRTEARLRESEERYRDLVENSHELIYTHDLHGQILSVNHNAAMRLGHNPNALLGKNLAELLAADEKAPFEDYLGRIRRKGSATGVWVLQSATGERRIWEYTSSLRSDSKQGPYVRGMAHDITERVRIEKELRESEERFQKIFDEGPIGTVLTSRDLKFFSANPAFCRMLGYTTEEMNTRTFLDVTHPEHRETDRQNLEKMWRGEISTYRTEKRYIAKNGDIRWGSLSTSLIRGQAGEPLYALAMVEDITERKQAEEALRESHQLLTKSFASLHDAIFILDKDTTEVKDCNPAASQLFGYDREEMLGRTTAFLHVDDQALAEFRKVLFKAVEEQGFLNQFEFRMKRRDGTIFPTEHSVMPIEDAHGKQSGWVSLVRDITERKQAEEALRESEYRYRTVFEGVEDAIFVQSTDGRILDANRGACEMFGYSHAEFLTKTVLDLVPSKDYVLASNPNELLALPIHSIETVELRANGERFPIEISLSLQTLHGEDVFFVVGRDISERKRTETLLQQAKAFAENLIHTANVIIISMDMTGKIQIFNETAEKITGYSRAELEGKNWFEVLVPKDRYPQVWQEFQLGGGGWPRVYENPILTKAGQERLISWQNNEVQEAGKIVGSISFGIDITERKRVEEALQRK